MATESRPKHDRQATEQSTEQSPGPEQTAQPRRDTPRASFSPFSIMRQGLDETERLFGAALRGEWDQFKRGWLSPASRGAFSMGQQFGDWSPAVEAFQRGNEFVIRADVPGMNRQDLQVEVGDDMVTLRGERREDRKEERDGVFWSERSYGSFTRVVPLPPGAITDSAKASFNNGVLEIVMPAPSVETRRGRRIDISGSGDEKK
jgi:HSP20 family protein